MTISLTLAVRTWAGLDAALAFFRSAPFEVASAQRLSGHCRKLHQLLLQAGVRCRYIPVALASPGRSLLRLRLQCIPSLGHVLTFGLPLAVARSLAEACLAIIEVQTDNDAGGLLLDHEVEELQSTRCYLSELKRQGHGLRTLFPSCYARRQLHWHPRRKEYDFTDRIGARVQQHYLRVGAGMN